MIVSITHFTSFMRLAMVYRRDGTVTIEAGLRAISQLFNLSIPSYYFSANSQHQRKKSTPFTGVVSHFIYIEERFFYRLVSGLSNDKARSFFSYKAEALSALWIELPKLNEDKFNGIKCSTSILNYSES